MARFIHHDFDVGGLTSYRENGIRPSERGGRASTCAGIPSLPLATTVLPSSSNVRGRPSAHAPGVVLALG